jgi:hypothetical protein
MSFFAIKINRWAMWEGIKQLFNKKRRHRQNNIFIFKLQKVLPSYNSMSSAAYTFEVDRFDGWSLDDRTLNSNKNIIFLSGSSGESCKRDIF